MNIQDVTITQLKRATAIKEQIDKLNKELASILGMQANNGAAMKNHRTMDPVVKRKIAASQRARWAKIRGAKPATRSAKPASVAKKKTMSPAVKAKLSAKLKAIWAAKKAAKK